MVDICGGSVAIFTCWCKAVAMVLQNCCIEAVVRQLEWAWVGTLCELVGFYFVALHLPVQGATIDI